MEETIASLKRKYEACRKGEEDVLAVRDETQLLLAEARKGGDSKVVDELEDILIDLQFSIEENTCKCHHKCSS